MAVKDITPFEDRVPVEDDPTLGEELVGEGEAAVGRRVPLEAWLEWRRQCTIEKCTEENRRELADFGRKRLRKYLWMLEESLALEYCSEEANREGAWLQMERHLFSERSSRRDTSLAGKRYKDLLLEQTESPGQMEGYLSRIFQRTIAREIARQESGSGLRDSYGFDRKGVSTTELDATWGAEDSEETRKDVLTRDAYGVYWIGQMAQADNSRSGEPEPEAAADAEAEAVGFSFEVEPVDCRARAEIDEALVKLAEELWGGWNDRLRLVFICL